jgi:hypothetical protein
MHTVVMTVPVILALFPSAMITLIPCVSGVTGRSRALARVLDMKLADAPVPNSMTIDARLMPALMASTYDDVRADSENCCLAGLLSEDSICDHCGRQ